MTNPALVTAVCPNGHGAPAQNSSRFCITCGAALIRAANPAQPIQYPAAPVPNFPAQRAAINRPAQAVPGFPPPQPVANWPAQGMPVYQGVQPVAQAKAFCKNCGGNGVGLPDSVLVCRECYWLRPLFPGYSLDCAAFQWSQDGLAMSKLRAIGPLNAVARSISDKAGRRWVETSFNGIRIGTDQLPQVYDKAVLAARLLGMPYMPEVYVSGDKMWDAMTFGSDNSSFIVLGTALLTNFQDDDLLFLLAREMGHCRAGHALWKTVIRFLIGEQGPRKGLMAGGVLHALNPTHLIEGALELPLLAWARQAEITADRAGLLTIGNETIARKVLLSWSLRSAVLYRKINVDAWLQQQEDSADDQLTRLSEIASSSTPYITRRLKLMTTFAQSPELASMHSAIAAYVPTAAASPSALPTTIAVPRPAKPQSAAQAKPAADAEPVIRVKCSACDSGMRIPQSALAGKTELNVRCPNPACGKIFMLKKKAASTPAVKTAN